MVFGRWREKEGLILDSESNWASLVAQWQRIHLQCRRGRRLRFDPWVRKIPWRKKWQPTPVFSSGESHGQRGGVGLQPIGSQRVRRNWACLLAKSNQVAFLCFHKPGFPDLYPHMMAGWALSLSASHWTPDPCARTGPGRRSYTCVRFTHFSHLPAAKAPLYLPPGHHTHQLPRWWRLSFKHHRQSSLSRGGDWAGDFNVRLADCRNTFDNHQEMVTSEDLGALSAPPGAFLCLLRIWCGLPTPLHPVWRPGSVFTGSFIQGAQRAPSPGGRCS